MKAELKHERAFTSYFPLSKTGSIPYRHWHLSVPFAKTEQTVLDLSLSFPMNELNINLRNLKDFKSNKEE